MSMFKPGELLIPRTLGSDNRNFVENATLNEIRALRMGLVMIIRFWKGTIWAPKQNVYQVWSGRMGKEAVISEAFIRRYYTRAG